MQQGFFGQAILRSTFLCLTQSHLKDTWGDENFLAVLLIMLIILSLGWTAGWAPLVAELGALTDYLNTTKSTPYSCREICLTPQMQLWQNAFLFFFFFTVNPSKLSFFTYHDLAAQDNPHTPLCVFHVGTILCASQCLKITQSKQYGRLIHRGKWQLNQHLKRDDTILVENNTREFYLKQTGRQGCGKTAEREEFLWFTFKNSS